MSRRRSKPPFMPCAVLLFGILMCCRSLFTLHNFVPNGIDDESINAPTVLSKYLTAAVATAKPIGGNNDEDHRNDLTDEDWVWSMFFHGLTQGDQPNPELLLNLYECPIFFASSGIRLDNDNSTTASRESCASSSSSSSGNTNHSSCVSLSDPPYSRIPTEEETWRLFEEAYYFAVDLISPNAQPPKEDRSHRDHDAAVQRKSFPSSRGMKIPYEVRYDASNPKLGRSIHTTAFVPKDTLVWTGSHTAGFTHDRKIANYNPTAAEVSFQIPTYRRFIEYLYNHYNSDNGSKHSSGGSDAQTNETEPSTRHNAACDALMWTYISTRLKEHHDNNDDNIENDDPKQINADFPPALCVAFDHGSLFNNAVDNETAVTVNDAPDLMDRSTKVFGLQGVARSPSSTAALPLLNLIGAECQFEGMKAARDIHPGEELRYDYSAG